MDFHFLSSTRIQLPNLLKIENAIEPAASAVLLCILLFLLFLWFCDLWLALSLCMDSLCDCSYVVSLPGPKSGTSPSYSLLKRYSTIRSKKQSVLAYLLVMCDATQSKNATGNEAVTVVDTQTR